MKKTILAVGLALGLAAPAAGPAFAAGGVGKIDDITFSFEGPFGSYDSHQLQRGLQVYTEICAACHGLEQVAFRTLGDDGGPHLSKDQVKAFAELWEVEDEEGEPGDTRVAKPFDKFPANDGVGAPDLSLMAKARAGFSGPFGLGLSQMFNGMGGSEYIYSLMTGYPEEPPECAPEDYGDGAFYYNSAFGAGSVPDECKDEKGYSTVKGSWIAMGPPLYGDDVEYQDGTEATLQQQAEDVAAFLTWAAEPKLNERKMAGFRNVIFLIVMAALLYFVNKKLWAGVKGKD